MSNETNETRRPGSARRRMRIGDTEREAMQAALSEHLTAGRLDMPEYERRVEQATAAVYAEDLDGLLDDLPRTEHDDQVDPGRRAWSDAWRPGRDGPPWASRPGGRPPWAGRARRGGFPVPLVIALAVVALFALPHAGWVLFPLLWFMFFAGVGRRMCGREQRHAHGHRIHGDRGDRIEV